MSLLVWNRPKAVQHYYCTHDIESFILDDALYRCMYTCLILFV